MTFSEQTQLGEKPLTWSDATARARALRESVETLTAEKPVPAAPMAPVDDPILPAAMTEDAPTSSLTEVPLASLAPLPAPPEPPSSLGLPVLPVPPVPPIFASTETSGITDLPFATEPAGPTETNALFNPGQPDDTFTSLPSEPADSLFATDQAEVDDLFASEPAEPTDLPFATNDTEPAALFTPDPAETNALVAPEPAEPTDLPFATNDTEPAGPETPSEAELAEFVKANSMPATTAFPTVVDASLDEPAAELPVPQVAGLPTNEALPPLPPPPPAPAPVPALDPHAELPPLPPPPPAPQASFPEPLNTPAETGDLSMFGTAAVADQVPPQFESGLPSPPPPPPPLPLGEPATTALAPAWDTPIETPVPVENPARSTDFATSAEPMAPGAFDTPFPTTVEPTEAWSLQPTEPAPFPSVDEPQIDTGNWLSATDDDAPDPAPHQLGEGMSLFGRPAAPLEAPLSESLETWPAAASGDWPTASSSGAAMPIPIAGGSDWPATEELGADPLLAAEPSVVTDPSAPAPVETPQAEGSAPRQSFFKRILTRKEEEPVTAPYMCHACDSPARVDIDSPSLGVRHLSCPKCSKMWTEPVVDEAPGVHT